MPLNAHLVKRLPHFTIDVGFACGAGELLAFVGPSGAGKTSIIRMLAGLEQPDAGIIRHDHSEWYDGERKLNLPTRKRQLSYVFQDHTLFPHLNVEKNIAFAALDPQRVEQLLTLLGITELRHRKPHHISGGERQRVALAQALASEPGLLLLDEPFSALDILTRKQLRKELKELKATLQIPIILVTHDLDECMYLADHVLPIDRGQITRDWLNRMLPTPTTKNDRPNLMDSQVSERK
ncbi:MAG: ATP-binding cassette domain-containing protein [Desulfobulbaceae bacterium]|nr:ATP-binding cassette domain-containing protein [Desulfobulbaceae bacterium]